MSALSHRPHTQLVCDIPLCNSNIKTSKRKKIKIDKVMQIQQLQAPKFRQGLIFESDYMETFRWSISTSTSHFQKQFPTMHFSQVTWWCALMGLASYLEILHCVLLCNGIGRLVIRAKIKRVKIHIHWLCPSVKIM